METLRRPNGSAAFTGPARARRRSMLVNRSRFDRAATLQFTLLFAVFVLGIAAIVYVSWPLVLALAVIGAVTYSWQLDREEQAAEPLSGVVTEEDERRPA